MSVRDGESETCARGSCRLFEEYERLERRRQSVVRALDSGGGCSVSLAADSCVILRPAPRHVIDTIRQILMRRRYSSFTLLQLVNELPLHVLERKELT